MNILFWSGGKDAYLALHFFLESNPEAEVKLLTTYNASDEIVPHQKIPIEEIKQQAEHLGLELIAVPLPPDCPNDIYLEGVAEALQAEKDIKHLIFGDWHLEDIREWREDVFGKLGYQCIFPIWKKSIHELLPVLLLNSIEVKISAVNKECETILKVGEPFNQKLVSQLSRLSDIDPMGEKGEFHTQLVFKNLDDHN